MLLTQTKWIYMNVHLAPEVSVEWVWDYQMEKLAALVPIFFVHYFSHWPSSPPLWYIFDSENLERCWDAPVCSVHDNKHITAKYLTLITFMLGSDLAFAIY